MDPGSVPGAGFYFAQARIAFWLEATRFRPQNILLPSRLFRMLPHREHRRLRGALRPWRAAAADAAFAARPRSAHATARTPHATSSARVRRGARPPSAREPASALSRTTLAFCSAQLLPARSFAAPRTRRPAEGPSISRRRRNYSDSAAAPGGGGAPGAPACPTCKEELALGSFCRRLFAAAALLQVLQPVEPAVRLVLCHSPKRAAAGLAQNLAAPPRERR
jgi:hypothetical protein